MHYVGACLHFPCSHIACVSFPIVMLLFFVPTSKRNQCSAEITFAVLAPSISCKLLAQCTIDNIVNFSWTPPKKRKDRQTRINYSSCILRAPRSLSISSKIKTNKIRTHNDSLSETITAALVWTYPRRIDIQSAYNKRQFQYRSSLEQPGTRSREVSGDNGGNGTTPRASLGATRPRPRPVSQGTQHGRRRLVQSERRKGVTRHLRSRCRHVFSSVSRIMREVFAFLVSL